MLDRKGLFALFVCILMISASALIVAVKAGSGEDVTVDDILNSNPNKVVRVSSASDFDDVSYGDVIFVNDEYDRTGGFDEKLKGAAVSCHPVISASGFDVFSDAGLSVAYPNDAVFVGYCRDPNSGESQCRSVMGMSDTDSVRGLCEWANGYADETVAILNSTYGLFDIAKYFFQVLTEDQKGNDVVKGGSLEALGKSTVSSTVYDTGHGSFCVRTTYTEYSEDDSRRYFRVSYIVESVPWKSGDQYRTADIKIISGIGEDGSNQRLESYNLYSFNNVTVHDYHEGDHYSIWYDIDENSILGKYTYMVQPQIEISTDKSIDNGSIRITDIYKVNFCKYGNSGDDWWRIFHIDKCHSFEYYSTSLYVEII